MEEPSKAMLFLSAIRRQKALTILACLLIASLFWFLNALNSDYSAIISYPIIFKSDVEKAVLTKPAPEKIELAVTGYGWYLLSYTIGLNNEPVVISPEDLHSNKYIASKALISLVREKLPNIKINSMINDTLWFSCENVINKTVFLKLDKARLNMIKGARIVGHVRINPAFIICRGPEGQINKLPDTTYFVISNQVIKSDFEGSVPINYRPSPEISRNLNQVHVSFKVQK